jgi:hypothetical protein
MVPRGASVWHNAEPNLGAAHCYDDQAAKETRYARREHRFIAALFVIAAAIVGGLALVCWHSRPPDTGNKPVAAGRIAEG